MQAPRARAKRHHQVNNPPVTELQKVMARQQVYRRLRDQAHVDGKIQRGVVHYDDISELRRRLGLERTMSMKLFKRSIWHLNTGDRESTAKPLIEWRRPKPADNWRHEDERTYVIILL